MLGASSSGNASNLQCLETWQHLLIHKIKQRSLLRGELKYLYIPSIPAELKSIKSPRISEWLLHDLNPVGGIPVQQLNLEVCLQA